MGIYRVFLLMSVFGTCSIPPGMLHAQFVTLEGRRFMVDGEEFYPVVMNYGMDFITNAMWTSDPAAIMASPAGAWDRSIYSYYEYDNQAELDLQLQQHFAKLTSMGFNAIRLYGLLPLMRWEYPNGPRHYSMEVRHNIHQFTTDPTQYKIDMDTPDFSGPLAMHMFGLLRHVIQLADQSGLKVILLCADDIGGTNQFTLATDQDAVDLYAAYLARLAHELKDEPGLLAYDLWNEPIWTSWELVQLSKADVCAYTAQWYDSIRSAGDKHLITLGGAPIAELGSWDPAVMKLDFYSPHIYPNPVEWNGYDLQNAFDRFGHETYWLSRSCPMPWIVGESGFNAEDDEVDPLDHFTGPDNQHLDAHANGHHQMPWMMGSEAEQAAFTQYSMDATRAHLGSGYSWWGFQNTRSENLNSPPHEYMHNWWGPLKYGNDAGLGLPAPWDVENPWRDKLMVEVLENYTLPPAPTALPAPPPAYANWHDLNTPVYRTYHLRDQHQQPVADGMAEVEWKYENADNPNLPPKSFWDHLVSGLDGSVVVRRPFPSLAGYDTPDNPAGVHVHASGAVSHYASGTPWPNGTTLTFPRNLLKYAATVSGVDLAWDPGRDYRAWAELTVEDATIVGSGTAQEQVRFVARQFVHVTGEFYAGADSEVHIHTGETFPDCNNPYYGMAPLPPDIPPEPKSAGEAQVGNIELRFLPAEPSLHVFPNPCMDRFTIEGDPQGPLTVFDTQGAIVHRGAKQADRLIVDTRQWLPGVYRLRLETSDGPHTLSITKVR